MSWAVSFTVPEVAPLWDQFIERQTHVVLDRWVPIFVERQPGGCMRAEQVAKTLLDSAFADYLLYLWGNVLKALPPGAADLKLDYGRGPPPRNVVSV